MADNIVGGRFFQPEFVTNWKINAPLYRPVSGNELGQNTAPVLRVDCSGDVRDTFSLPDAAAVPFVVYTFLNVSPDGTVAHILDSEDDPVIDLAKDDAVQLFSDGLRWWVLMHTQQPSTSIVAFDLEGTATVADAALGSYENPGPTAMIVTNAYLYVSAQSTGACLLDIGFSASEDGKNDKLFDGRSVAAAGVFTPGGTNGGVPRLWSAGEFLTLSPSASSAGLVGRLFVEYLNG